MNRFILIKSFGSGHRYFIDRTNGRIAVADESGRTPDQTDDGVLYADFTRHDHATVGLLGPNGRRCSSPAPAIELAWFTGVAQ